MEKKSLEPDDVDVSGGQEDIEKYSKWDWGCQLCALKTKTAYFIKCLMTYIDCSGLRKTEI